MEPIYYEALTKRKNQEQAMKAVLNEMVTYFIYVSIIFMLAYGNRDHSLFLQKQQLETTIIFGKLFEKIVIIIYFSRFLNPNYFFLN